MPKTEVDISKLKDFVFKRVPKDWPLREILISEKDRLNVQIFLSRLPVWLKLSSMSNARGK